MQARCPNCANVFATQRMGLQMCPRCGQQVNVADVGDAEPAATSSTPSGAGTPTPGAAGAPAPDAAGNGRGAPPPPGSPDLHAGRAPTPWERRDEIGLLRGVWETWRDTIIAPEQFWKKVRPDGSQSDAFLYAWLLAVLGALVQAPLSALSFVAQAGVIRQMMSQIPDLPPQAREITDRLFQPGSALILVAVVLLSAVLTFPLSIVIRAAVLHLFCMMVGCAKNGFRGTFRVVGYAYAPEIMLGLPFIGIAAWFYGLVEQMWGIQRVHETTVGRAAVAVFALPVLLLCCCCLYFVAVISMALGALR